LTAKVLADAGHDVYLYEFIYHFKQWIDPAGDLCQFDRELLCGNFHASELRFVWDNYIGNEEGDDTKMSMIFQEYWTNFAKYGSPNDEGSDAAAQHSGTRSSAAALPEWKKFTSEEGAYMGLVKCAFSDRNLHSRMPLVPTPARLKQAGV
jgi:carboxylesterase type B